MKKAPDLRTPLLGMFRSPRRLFEKARRDGEAYVAAQRDGELVRAEDAFFDFVVTTHSIIDWAKYVRPDLEDEIFGLLNREPSLQSCQLLANGAKHAKVDVSRDEYELHQDLTLEALASGAIDFDVTREVHLKTVHQSGARIRVTDLIQEALGAWDNFLRAHGL